MSAAKKLLDSTTGREKAFDRAELVRDLDRTYNKGVREKIAGLRTAVKSARADLVGELSKVVDQCRANKENAEAALETAKKSLAAARGGKKAKQTECQALVSRCRTERRAADELYRTAKAAHDGARKGKRAEAETCKGNKAKVKAEKAPPIAKAKKDLDEERRDRATIRRNEASARKTQASRKPKVSAAERQKEADQRVEQNIPPELVPLWRKEKDRFKGSPHVRATAFLESVEENPHDAVAAREPDRRSLERELQREQERHFLTVQESKPKRRAPKLSAEARTISMFEGAVMHQRGRRGALAAPPALKLSVQEPASPPAGPPVDTRSVQMFPSGGYKNPGHISDPDLSDIPF